MATVKIAGRELQVREATTGLYLRTRAFIAKLADDGRISFDELASTGMAILWECMGDDTERMPVSINPGLTIEWLQDHTKFPLATEFFDVIGASGIPVARKSEKTDAPAGEAAPQ